MRNPAIDNIKIFMIFFVVFGHLIEPLIAQSLTIKTVWVWIYSFHMPVFIMGAGLFSKAEYWDGFLLKQVSTIIVPLIVFIIIYELMHLGLTGQTSNYAVHVQPYWILWFLLSMFFWRLLLPIILKLKFPITVTICVSMIAGYIDSIGMGWGLSRTLYFFPFFCFGHTILPKYLEYIRRGSISKYVLWAGLFLSVIIITALPNLPHNWVLGSKSYSLSGYDSWYAGAYRLGWYAFSFSVSLLIIGLIPNKEFRITPMGRNSLYIYLWHGIFVKIFIAAGLISFVGTGGVFIALFAFLLLAIALVYILSLDIIQKTTDKYLFGPFRK